MLFLTMICGRSQGLIQIPSVRGSHDLSQQAVRILRKDKAEVIVYLSELLPCSEFLQPKEQHRSSAEVTAWLDQIQSYGSGQSSYSVEGRGTPWNAIHGKSRASRSKQSCLQHSPPFLPPATN